MIKATIVLLAAHIVMPWLKRRSAAERHALWTTALAIAALLPLLTWLLPSWEPDWARRAASVWPAAFESRSAADSAGDIVIRATAIETGAWTLVSIASWVWLAGCTLLLCTLARQGLRLRRLTRSGNEAPARHRLIAGRVADSLALAAPRLTCSDQVRIPLAWGVRRPHILLPHSAQDWPDDRVWAVCAHEMAHIARGDWIAHLLAEIACRVYWFNPLFWMARDRMNRDSERAADDIVIGLGARGVEYASHLLEIVRASQPNNGVVPTVAMARLRAARFHHRAARCGGQVGAARPRSGFEDRIAALLNGLVNRARLSRRGAAAMLAGACIVAGPLAALGAGGRSSIEIQTSNLPPIGDLNFHEDAGDGSEPVRDIRLIAPLAGDVAPSVAEYTTPPLYSDEARRRSLEGVVLVRADIDASGRVRDAQVTRALGAGLEQNALVALRQWRFHPGTRNGAAVPMDVEIEIAFTLRNESINAQIANDMVSLVGPGVTPPQAVRVVNPRSPRDRLAGTVMLDVVLLEDGSPRIVRILRSLRTDLDDIAVEAFTQWRFSPALKDGRPIKVRMNAAVRFHG
jgi:TonB family protein